MLITSSWLVDIILLIFTSSFLVYKYSTRKYGYWKKRGVFYFRPLPVVGNFLEIFTFKTTIGWLLKRFYDSTKEPFFGIFVYDEPHLVLKSPELIKQVLVKDFNYFMDRTIVSPKHDSLIANMLFIQKNPAWKGTRSKLTPVFTSGKLKGMFSIVNNTGLEMSQYIRKNQGTQEAKEICAKFSTDVITKCAFGIHAHSFEKGDADFRKIGRTIFDFRWRTAIAQTAYFFMPDLVNLMHLEFVEKSSLAFLSKAFWSTIKLREQTNTKGMDLIDTIIEIKKNKDLCKEIQFEGENVVSQAVQFFLAGFETTSTTLAFTLYELCINPHIQDKLRKEILDNIKENGLTYDSVKNMKYLDMCVMETLRMYPVLPFLDRRCNADYKISGTNVVIEKGTPVYVPMLGLHYDEQYFPEPHKYKPERFCEENKYNVDGLYYLPFGEGPRVCIGARFASLGTKVGLVNILSEFVLEKTPETPDPLEFEPKSFFLQSKVGLPMRFKEYRSTTA